MSVFLAVRALFFVALLPGMIAGYVPYRMLLASGELRRPPLGVASACAAAVTLFGVAVLLRCVWDFFASGKGTLAPVDPPRHLVVNGLYRYTRNPMYNGVLLILLGEAWLFTSTSLLGYAAIIFLMFHTWVLIYEEPALTDRFAESYLAYRRAVPRWGFASRPYTTSNR